jgi:hypothetical protein
MDINCFSKTLLPIPAQQQKLANMGIRPIAISHPAMVNVSLGLLPKTTLFAA